MARESFNHSTTVNAPRTAVWAALDLPETWNAVAGVERVHEPVIDDDGKLRGFKFDTVVAGRAYEGIARPHARVEGEAMSWDIANSQIRGLLHVELADADHGTLLNVGIDMEAASMMSRMFFGVIASTVRDGLPRTMEDLAHQGIRRS